MSDIFYGNQRRYVKQIIELEPNVKFKPKKGTIWVENLEVGEFKIGGITVASDSQLSGKRLNREGIHPRWATIYAVADDLKDLFKVGQKVYLVHGCWTDSFDFLINGKMKSLWMIPKKDVLEGIMAVSDS